jgi:transcriptional regulator of acetoin/glycerol metabolism
VQVNGPEHFAESLHTFSCAGAPIAHPVSRAVLGTLDVTCRLRDASPFVLSWVTELGREVENALLDSTSRRERLLLRSYLANNHDSRHPLIVLDQHTVISNAVAARLLDSVDQAMLWEHASRALADGREDAGLLSLSTGGQISIRSRAVTDGGQTIGAVLRIKPVADPVPAAPREPGGLPGLVGVSPAWRELCARARRSRTRDRLLITGEAGSGRTAVAQALLGAGPHRLLDAWDAEAVGFQRWLAELGSGEEPLILRHADRLGPELSRATAAALTDRPRRRVLGTADTGAPGAGPADPLLAGFDAVLEVPPLRSRLDDLPALLTALTARTSEPAAEVRWLPEAVQVLTRLDWPGNVAALDALVRRIVAQFPRGGRVAAADLPPDVVAQAGRRRLATLEQAEARAILTALRDAGGNKDQAAKSLGIARSTVYRKMRALGLDLSSSAF